MRNKILITGASSDIGIQLIKSISEEGTIIAHYNNNNERLMDLQKTTIKEIIPVQADFSSDSSLKKMIDLIDFDIGAPNKIIHLASSKFEYIKFKDVSWSQIQEELHLSLGSLTEILHRFLPKMVTKKNGRIITILSSVTLGVPPKALSKYTTTKYALLGLMKSLSSEYANKGITFNCISPSMIETQFLSKIDARIVQMNANSHPLKRNATISDLIPLILILMSDKSSYLNGINLPLTGGARF